MAVSLRKEIENGFAQRGGEAFLKSTSAIQSYFEDTCVFSVFSLRESLTPANEEFNYIHIKGKHYTFSFRTLLGYMKILVLV